MSGVGTTPRCLTTPSFERFRNGLTRARTGKVETHLRVGNQQPRNSPQEMLSPETTPKTSMIPSHPVKANPLSSSFVMKDLGPNDVLLGRGTGPNEQIGNIRFRALVRDVIQASGKRGLDGKEKTRLAKSVIQEVKAKGGRFVRKVEAGAAGAASSTSSDPNKSSVKVGDHYEEVSDALALDKTKQSFRHQLRGTSSISSPGGVRRQEVGGNFVPPIKSSSTTSTAKNGNKQEASPKKMIQDPSSGNDRQPLPRSILLQRSSSASSGGTSASSPGQQRQPICSTSTTVLRSSTSSNPYLADGLLKLKSLQHERSDLFCTGPPGGSFVDQYLLTGLVRNSLFSTCASTNELMRKELAARYLLAEAILLGGGVGVRESSTLVPHLGGRPEEGLLALSPPFVHSAARINPTLGAGGTALRSRHVLTAAAVSQQRVGHLDTGGLPMILENTSSRATTPPIRSSRSTLNSFQHVEAPSSFRKEAAGGSRL